MDLHAYRAQLEVFLDAHAVELAPEYPGTGTVEQEMRQIAKVRGLLHKGGFMQWGWPERVGGAGGTALFRAVLGEAVNDRDLVNPGYFSMTEVLGPALIEHAPPELSAVHFPRFLSGEESWCQGFSEPGAGSDLAALTCRAVRDGDRWIINGQKLWTSLSAFSQRCLLLTRTGAPESRHRGITAFFVDVGTPGMTVRPLEIISSDDEFAEVFFDDAVVPDERRVGEVDGGWAVAMGLLPYERSTSFWARGAYLRNRLGALARACERDAHAEALVGAALAQTFAFRARSRQTQHRLAAGEVLGAETSIDKVLVATAEQRIFEAARHLLPAGTIELAHDAETRRWRDNYLYSRAATVYGGTSEVQRNIIARRLLGLGDDA